MKPLDDDVFYGLGAAYHGHVLEARTYQKLLRLGYVVARVVEGRRTWLTDSGRQVYLAEDRRRDALPPMPALMVVEEDDEENPPVATKRPSGTYRRYVHDR